MIAEDFVTYEQALDLKKLGFTEKCLYFYEKNKELVFTIGAYPSSLNKIDSCSIDAPTLTQAQQWLRKVKLLHISPVPLDKDKWSYYIYNLNNHLSIATDNHKYMSSYENALSVGITECLKLLEKED